MRGPYGTGCGVRTGRAPRRGAASASGSASFAGVRADQVVKEIDQGGGQGWAVRADAADAEQVWASVAGAVERSGRLDILVNNAGVGVLGPFEGISLEDVDRVLRTNVRGPFLAAQAAAAHLGEGGRYITGASIAVDGGFAV
ncbi:SDR family NAD(P)-dependent oxidoreductase [Streptomyces platensis]